MANYPLADKISEAFDGARVFIDNDARQAATAELSHGKYAMEQFLYLYCNIERKDDKVFPSHFGLCSYINGMLYKGANSAAGDLMGAIYPQNPPALSEEDLEQLRDPNGSVNKNHKKVIEWLCPYLTSFISVLDPQRIIFGGNIQWKNKLFFES